MIIDSHCHVDKTKVKELLVSMDEAGIDYSLLIADCAPVENGTTTEEVIKIGNENPRLKAIGCLEYKKLDEKQIERLIGYLRDNKIYGLKLYPGYENFYPQDEKLFPLYEECQKLGKPVIFHTGFLEPSLNGRLKQVHPLNLDEVAVSFPDLKIVMAHFGNPWKVDAMMVLMKNKNVHADISGYFEVHAPIKKTHIKFFVEDLKYQRDYLGSFNKFLFGTDYPLYSQREYVEAAQELPLTEEERELVFWKNANELFQLGL